MIKNENLKVGLLVFAITLIGLIIFAEFSQEDNLDVIEDQSVTADANAKERLDIAVK